MVASKQTSKQVKVSTKEASKAIKWSSKKVRIKQLRNQGSKKKVSKQVSKEAFEQVNK